MQRVGFAVFPGFQAMSLGVLSVFEFANRENGEPIYDVRPLSETGGPIRSSTGISVVTEPFAGTELDTLIVAGSVDPAPATPGLINFVRQASERCRRGAAGCSRAVLLPGAG